MFKVVIAGRPNVGKSSLFNALAGVRTAIVDPTSGVTRDRISTVVDFGEGEYELTDTGGIGVVDVRELKDEVERQILMALEQADLILFMVDALDGLVAADREIAKQLRKYGRPIYLLANKVDNDKARTNLLDFNKLGFGEAHSMTLKQRRGIRSLRDRIARDIPNGKSKKIEPAVKVAFMGRRNVGKSSLINALANEERVIVSEHAGTTRDAVDVEFTRGEEKFIAIDTAGLRKKGKYDTQIDFYSTVRSNNSINNCDVVILVLDATEGMGRVDKRIADAILESYKPCVIVVNKWDLAEGRTTPEIYEEYLTKILPGFSYVPLVFASAETGFCVWQTVRVARDLLEQTRQRISTSYLNNKVMKVIKERSPGAPFGKVPKIYYATQTDSTPPTIVLSVNNEKLFADNYKRYLINALREELPYKEVPIKLIFKERGRGEK